MLKAVRFIIITYFDKINVSEYILFTLMTDEKNYVVKCKNIQIGSSLTKDF